MHYNKYWYLIFFLNETMLKTKIKIIYKQETNYENIKKQLKEKNYNTPIIMINN